jgi:hypothetical protein
MLLLYLVYKVIDAIDRKVTHFVDWLRAMPGAVWESFDAWVTRSNRRMVERDIARIERRIARRLRIESAISGAFARVRGMFVRSWPIG